MTTKIHETLRSARSGNGEQLNALLERHYPTVRRIVRRSIATNRSEAQRWSSAAFCPDDIVQEVFLAVVSHLDRFEGETEGQFVRFLVTISRNRLLDTLRFHRAERRDRRRCSESLDGIDVASGEAPALDRTVTVDEVARYREMLDTFDARTRTLLSERLESSTTYDTLAHRLRYSSADACKKAFYTARNRIALQLRPRRVRK